MRKKARPLAGLAFFRGRSPLPRAAALIKSAARRPQDTCSEAEIFASRMCDRRRAAGAHPAPCAPERNTTQKPAGHPDGCAGLVIPCASEI
ncbi:hypothetical protein D3Z39_11640 [Anaerotruncus colihominis]|uniref:Uncharacterized protein n=1 Tax=Anaerotruncus colihominis TaxID=169435 RepID=A0A845RJ13_9FIRM|nr:hypothetical protein [Anaerotruncus colihominis]